MATSRKDDAPQNEGMEKLRKSETMGHLLGSLEKGEDIGHYGRFVFASVARHFLGDEELVALLAKDRDFSEEQAMSLVHQVKDHDYSPPRREKLMEFQAQQEFPIVPNPDDPDAGNLYRELDFPDEVFEHISQYHEQKERAGV